MKKKKAFLCCIFVFMLFVFAFLFFVLPKSEYSANEKRVLSKAPVFSIAAVSDGSFMKEFESYLEDHFPFRDLFVGINSYFKLMLGENGASGIYKCKDGYLIAKQDSVDTDRARKNINTLLEFASGVNLPYYMITVPSAGYMMNDVLPKLHTEYADGKITDICASLCEKGRFIDVRPVFEKSRDDTQLYYKTDHHLTSRGAMLMYGEFCRYTGIEQKTFTLTHTEGGFYGTAYSKSGLWLTKPDEIEIWKSDNTSFSVTVTDGEESREYNGLYFTSHLEEPDKYPVFLDGNHAIVKVKNGECKNGKRLLIIKDSFAHCFATFLIENYEEICMIDLRYYRQSVRDVIEGEKLNELLFLYGAENLASSTDIPWLAFL